MYFYGYRYSPLKKSLPMWNCSRYQKKPPPPEKIALGFVPWTRYLDGKVVVYSSVNAYLSLCVRSWYVQTATTETHVTMWLAVHWQTETACKTVRLNFGQICPVECPAGRVGITFWKFTKSLIGNGSKWKHRQQFQILWALSFFCRRGGCPLFTSPSLTYHTFRSHSWQFSFCRLCIYSSGFLFMHSANSCN